AGVAPMRAAIAGEEIIVVAASEIERGRDPDSKQAGDIDRIECLESRRHLPAALLLASVIAEVRAAVVRQPQPPADMLVELAVLVVGAILGRSFQTDLEVRRESDRMRIGVHEKNVLMDVRAMRDGSVHAVQSVPRRVVGGNARRDMHVTVVGKEQQKTVAGRFRCDIAISARTAEAAVHRRTGKQRPARVRVVELEPTEVTEPDTRLAGEALAIGIDEPAVGDDRIVRGPKRSADGREKDFRGVLRMHGQYRRRVSTAIGNPAAEIADAVAAAAALKSG